MFGNSTQFSSELNYSRRFRGQETDEVRAKEHLDKLEGKLDAYEAILGKQKYISGEVCTRNRSVSLTAC